MTLPSQQRCLHHVGPVSRVSPGRHVALAVMVFLLALGLVWSVSGELSMSQQRWLTLPFAILVGFLSYAMNRWGQRAALMPVGEIAKTVEPSTGVPPRNQPGDALRFQEAAIESAEDRESPLDTASLLSTVLDGMQEGVFAVDRNHQVIFSNRGAERILDIPKGTGEGRPFNEFTRNAELRESVQNMLNEDLASSHEASLEIITGTKNIYAVNARRLPGSPFPGVVVVMHDVTELRRLEKVRREFVANVSHELKTPLSCIKAYAETLQAGAIDDPAVNRNFLTQIEEQADRLHELILDMLKLARLEAGSEAFHITSVPLNLVVAEAMYALEEPALSKNIELTCVAEEGDVQVRADEEGVRQILDNLIDNAIKYSQDGGNVAINWRTEDGFAIIEVSDQGIGVRPEDHVAVFGRFYRVDRARSRELGSTGLGLSIVKHLAQAFGGSVGLESEYGVGSTFSVKLPLA